MKTALCFFSFLAASAWAAEADDQAAIGRVLSALNEVPQKASLFTADADGLAGLSRLQNVSKRTVNYRWEAPNPSDSPLVVISKEPLGEVTLTPLKGTAELTNPRISSGLVRFITPDVALAEGTCEYHEDSKVQTTRLFFVLKRYGDEWKIASMRVLGDQ
jgi:hypothetical protein